MTPKPIVIKVGGSLLAWPEFPARLRHYLLRLNEERVVLVVGGGRAADFVRELDSAHGIGENQAHALALRALDLTAHLAAALLPGLQVTNQTGELEEIWQSLKTPVFAPRVFLETIDANHENPLPATWNVTTDSIAVRIADFLNAKEFQLLKSVGTGNLKTRDEAAQVGLVDPAFPRVSQAFGRVTFVNLRENPIRLEWLL